MAGGPDFVRVSQPLRSSPSESAVPEPETSAAGFSGGVVSQGVPRYNLELKGAGLQ